MGAAAATRARVREDIVRFVHRGDALPKLTHDVGRALRRAVPFDGICLITMDPATLLPTGEVVENGLPSWARTRLTEIELGEPDVNKFTDLARSSLPAASLSAATGGDLDRSRRQREVRRPSGFDDELRAVLSGPTGTWGSLTLLRAAGEPRFTEGEVAFVASVATALSDGVRRTVLMTGIAADVDAGTGFVVVAPDDSIEMTNPAADEWLVELASADGPQERLPVAVRAVVAQTRRVAAGATSAAAAATDAVARVHTRRGRWAVVRGTVIGPERVGLLIEAARPAELAESLGNVYGLSDRERAVTRLVARGLQTSAISERLHVSQYTVQDHLKSIFDKTGTSSRGELIARLFLDLHADESTNEGG